MKWDTQTLKQYNIIYKQICIQTQAYLYTYTSIPIKMCIFQVSLNSVFYLIVKIRTRIQIIVIGHIYNLKFQIKLNKQNNLNKSVILITKWRTKLLSSLTRNAAPWNIEIITINREGNILRQHSSPRWSIKYLLPINYHLTNCIFISLVN